MVFAAKASMIKVRRSVVFCVAQVLSLHVLQMMQLKNRLFPYQAAINSLSVSSFLVFVQEH